MSLKQILNNFYFKNCFEPFFKICILNPFSFFDMFYVKPKPIFVFFKCEIYSIQSGASYTRTREIATSN
jgi:hypothetical protein